ncbi:hypothetical protein, partial [Neokomagataea anthophila]|uniref:hypothetical protein n=1 Tax=Neokomagataea anthophila TaxID=2826925 RepID=UPI001BA8BC0D
MVLRQRWDGVWSSWRSIAFEDGNIASANKLRTPRKIFGQTFDGSSDISGIMSGVRSIGGESNASIDYITSAGHH